ncbi:hypothetical protein H9P43_007745 [Blastocladiella emersonii ATCC 22665]|nr:hypothetical protein H9P43_007745 [Blastocladiella emersonii ATCC 22665]
MKYDVANTIALPETVTPALFGALLALVEEKMGGNDGSHDVEHVLRVVRVALRIARAEAAAGRAPNVDLRRVVVVGMLHDVTDHKYIDDPAEANRAIYETLQAHGFTSSDVAWVLDTIELISFRKEQARIAAAAAAGQPLPSPSPELCAVQDADRLDAIGAIGIARCFTFGGSRSRALYEGNHTDAAAIDAEVSKTGAFAASPASLYHFYEKLFKLKDLMKTETGRKMAERRQAAMHRFVDQFWSEVALDEDE